MKLHAVCFWFGISALSNIPLNFCFFNLCFLQFEKLTISIEVHIVSVKAVLVPITEILPLDLCISHSPLYSHLHDLITP